MKIVSSLIFLTLLLYNCVFFQEKSECSGNETSVRPFEGLVMLSDDSGKTWTSKKTDVPEDFNPVSVYVEENTVYMGGNYGNLYRFTDTDFSTAKKENILASLPAVKPEDFHWVSGIFPSRTGMYVFVDGAGIFYKKQGQSYWQPIPTPEGIYHANEIHEDSEGSIYIVAQHGVFRSTDKGKDWQRIFRYGFAHDMLVFNDKLMVNGINGVYSSEDKGTTWTSDVSLKTLTGDQSNSHSSLFEKDNMLYFFKKREYSEFGPEKKNQLFISKDRGLSWEKHTAHDFLNEQSDIYSLMFYNNKLFCSTRQGVLTSSDNGKTWTKILSFPKDNKNYSCKIIQTGNNLACVRIMAGC